MVNKKELLKNISNYSPEEIADAVKNGVVSLYELSKETNGAFTPLLRKKVKELLEQVSVTIEQNNREEISETENPIISREPTVVEAPHSEEIETTDIFDDTILTSQHEQEVAKINIESKPGMFRNPFSFKGRIRRTEYGLSLIICFFLNLLMQGMVGAAAESDAAAVLLILYFIMFIPYCWFIWAQGAKRCHDRGNSGWYQIIPFYGFWLLFAKGEAGTNEYGNSPK